MPQLNPLPWLMIFLLIWTFILLLLLNKILNSTYLNTPMSKEFKKTMLTPWNWPWY